MARGAETLRTASAGGRANGGAWCAAQAYRPARRSTPSRSRRSNTACPSARPPPAARSRSARARRTVKAGRGLAHAEAAAREKLLHGVGPRRTRCALGCRAGASRPRPRPPANDDAPAPGDPGSRWRAPGTGGLARPARRTLAMYVRGRCVDWRLLYAYPGRSRPSGTSSTRPAARPPRRALAAAHFACRCASLSRFQGGPLRLYYRRRRDCSSTTARPSPVFGGTRTTPSTSTPSRLRLMPPCLRPLERLVIVDARGPHRCQTSRRWLRVAYPPLPRGGVFGRRAPTGAAALSLFRRRVVPRRRAVHSAPPVLHAIVPPPPAALYRRSAARPHARKTRLARPAAAAI